MNSIVLSLAALGLLGLVYKSYGKAGLRSVLLLAGILLAKDAAFHFFGRVGEWVVVGLFSIFAVTIYVLKRKGTV